MPRHHHRESIRLSSSPSTISVPLRLRATWSCSVWVTMNWMTAFIWWLQTRKSYQALWLTPPSCRHLLYATPDSEWMKISSQAMRHFLPKSTSSSSASSHPRPAPTQQTAKPTPTTSEPRPPEGRQDRGRSCSAWRYPFLKCQESRPKIALDPVPQESSWTARQKEEGPKSRYLWTTPQAAINVLLATPLNSGCRGMCVYGSSRAHYSAQVSDRCDSGQNKTHRFSKREQKYFSANHKHPALMQPVYTTVTTPCHTDRGLAGHPRCVSMGYVYGKTRLYTPICSKDTALLRCACHQSAQRGRPSPLRRGDESAGKRKMSWKKEQCLFRGMDPIAVQRIWEDFGRARVDLFASEDNSHCQSFLQGARMPLPTIGPAFRSTLSPRSLCYWKYSGESGNNGTSCF